ncbi:MAG: hypothetical protein VYE77_11460, partial [Planctomycetota bacterium]|nr:hypothetical protein [Planctomycetota bacterium]
MRGLVCALICCALSPAQQAEWTHSTLPDGARLSVLYAPDALRQSTFLFAPLGLCADAPHRAQFAHLVEHMLIRAVDPGNQMDIEGIALNGETGLASMRLETIAPPDQWRTAVTRPVQWFAARSFDQETLTNEKRKIAMEERNTTANGFTHKWAGAAWNQVINHGLQHAKVHGDVAAADLTALRTYVDQHVRWGPDIHLYSVGPTPAESVHEAVAAAVEEHVSDSAPTEPGAHRPPSSPEDPEPPADRTATWDLPARHYIEYYELPDQSTETLAAAKVLTQLLTLQLMQAPELRQQGVQPLASLDYQQGKRRLLAISMFLPEKALLEEVQGHVTNAIAKTPNEFLARQVVAQMVTQLAVLPDFAKLRKGLANPKLAELLEANLLLQLAMQEQSLGVDLADL